MQIQLVDPSAFTPPYDHALAAALARAGADVELVTSRFLYGSVPQAQGYDVNELFYRRTARRGLHARGRMAYKLAEHVPDMLRYRRHAELADLIHWQWLTVQPLDVHLLPRKRPQVLTAHDVLPREPRPGQLASTRRLLRRMDAVVVHSEHGARRLRDEAGVDADRVHVIRLGAFEHLTRPAVEHPLPPELAAVEGPVVLFFGLLREYKGVDVLLEAFAAVEGAELWIVGMPRMPLGPLRELAARAPGRVRFVDRFVPDDALPAFFRRADLAVLPYREIDQSAVLYTALAFGTPLVLSSVGGFTEFAEETGAGRLVPPGDPAALASALRELLADPAARERLGAAAARASAGEYSWDTAARRTLELYRTLLGGS
jgi:glycosyltransferase involved in cell wall biosynthesis